MSHLTSPRSSRPGRAVVRVGVAGEGAVGRGALLVQTPLLRISSRFRDNGH